MPQEGGPSRPGRVYHEVLDHGAAARAGGGGGLAAPLLSGGGGDAGGASQPPYGAAGDGVEEEEEEEVQTCRERSCGKELGCIDVPKFWKKPGRGWRTWLLRSIVIFITLSFSTYIAMSIKCFDGYVRLVSLPCFHPRFAAAPPAPAPRTPPLPNISPVLPSSPLSARAAARYNWIIQGFLQFPPCNEYMPETWGKAPGWQIALAGNKKCLLADTACLAALPRVTGNMRNAAGQALCTNNGGKTQFGGCSPTNIVTLYCTIVVNFLLAAFYFAGEYCIKSFDENSGDHYSRSVNGPKWQLELDKADESRGKRTPHQKVETDAIKHSSQWNDELAQWHELKARGKEVVGKDLGGRAIVMYILFFGVATFDILMVMLISPSQRSTASYDPGAWILDNIVSTINILPLSRDPVTGNLDVWTIPFFSNKPGGGYKFHPLPTFGSDYGIYAYIILGQFSLEFVLFMMCVITVRWQQPTVIADRNAIASGRMRRVDVGRLKNVGAATDMVDQTDESLHKIRDSCLLIACHLSTIAPDATETFCNTLRAALRVFPPSAVFVCDNHPYNKDHYKNKTIGPFDRTEEVCDLVSKEFHPTEKINYVFIPEGNKVNTQYSYLLTYLLTYVRTYLLTLLTQLLTSRTRCTGRRSTGSRNSSRAGSASTSRTA